MSRPKITMTISELSISVLPEDHPDYESYRVCVRWHGEDSYGIHRGAACLSSLGKWEVEPIPSARSERWAKTHRWSYVEAQNRACEVVTTISINGRSVLDLIPSDTS